MDASTPPNTPQTTPQGTPQPVPAGTPVPPKVLTPEEKKAKRKQTLKRLAVVLGIVYGVMILVTFAWAFISYGKEFSLFDYLPLSQNAFSGVLMKIFNIQLGFTVGILFLLAVFALLKSLLLKKEEVERKKSASRLSLFAGLGFLGVTVAWLAGIWFLGPRLVIADYYGSPITTVPSDTIGLTSPIEISFDASNIPVDTDTYKILSYTWDFGDGSTSTGVTTSHNYTQKAQGDGVYTVVLTVRYMDLLTGEQFEDDYKTTVAISNEKTAAYFTANPEGGEVPLDVHFDATGSYDPDGEIVAYEWDFDGDGQFDDGTGEEADYTFTQEGDYDVTLRVTDNSGEYNTSTITIEAGSINGLRAVISSNVGDDEIYYVGEDYEFDGSLSQVEDGKITKYSWDFGDGSDEVKTRSVTHAFETAGTYTVTLTIYDQDGNSDVTTLEVKAKEEGATPTAKFTTSPAMENGAVSGSVPLTVSFDANSSTDPDDDIIDYEWDFDNDGEVDDTGDKASHTYQEVGNYEARLILTDAVGNQDEYTVPVEVTEQGIIARLEISVSNGEVPLTVQFDAGSSSYKEGNIVSYEYNFGDGSDSYIGGSSVTYKYTSVGTFNASVTVTGGDGTKDTTSVQVVVRPVALTACFTVNTDSGRAPLFVSVDPSCSEGTISTYEWNFGDGVISYDRKPETHTYSTAGTYVITLEVTSAEGIVDVFENTITVN